MSGVQAEAQEAGCRIPGGQVGGEFITPSNQKRLPPPLFFLHAAYNGAYCPPGSFCRTAPGVSGMETLSGGGKMNRMSEAIA